MALFRRGPGYVEAFRWAVDADPGWFSDAIIAGAAVIQRCGGLRQMVVTTDGADLIADQGDWIGRRLDGSLFVSTPAQFRTRYVRA